MLDEADLGEECICPCAEEVDTKLLNMPMIGLLSLVLMEPIFDVLYLH